VSAEGAASVTSGVAKVIVNPKVPDVEETATPTVTPQNQIDLEMGGVEKAYVSISLGASSIATPTDAKADKAD
jgi:hypothetical protein